MRVLFSSSAGDGHVLPLLPLALAFRDRGDEVAIATGPSLGPRIEEAGLTALAAGLDVREVEALFAPDRAEIESLPIAERRPHQFSRRFGRVDAPARIEELRTRVRELEPDVLVHETAELAAPVIAAELGLPSVQHGFGRRMPTRAIEAALAEVAPMWHAAGLEPDAHAGLFRDAYVDICPPSLEPEPPPRGVTVLPMRAAHAQEATRDGARPLVYVTIGTVIHNIGLLRTLVAALAPVDADVLVTTGAQNDRSEIGPVPPNTTVEPYVPQAQVLPRASLVVTHGGSGSMLGALAHGLPLLAVPHLADQFDNAAAAERAGVARVLLPHEIAESSVREAAETLLADDAYRVAAVGVAEEIAAMPPPAEVAGRIAELVVSRGARAHA
jgi:UDP:flavonoid glycosyltransferase YjiC (YdhE family)